MNEIFIGLQDLIELKNISLSEKEEEIRDELQETMDRMRENRKKVLEKHEEKRQRLESEAEDRKGRKTGILSNINIKLLVDLLKV